MKFDKASEVEEIVWYMRDNERVRSEGRAVLNREYNGEPPYDEKTAEENGIQINRNFLSGVQVLADARRQWNNGFLNTPNYFAVTTDFGKVHEREAYSSKITNRLNRLLKKKRPMLEQARATGALTMLHGIGPSTWRDANDYPYPNIIAMDSLLIPEETEIDFENLTRFAVFRQYTPYQLIELSNGTHNPGWNRKLVGDVIKRATESKTKNLQSYAEYSPEKLAETIKQGAGFWDSDAVPTVDCWDFFFLEESGEGGQSVYRRIILDWPAADGMKSGSRGYGDGEFLYSSGSRPYCDSIDNILHCQFGDCSAVAPFKYHSVRSLGWLLWGVCDLQNRLECRFSESVFEELMWFFRVASNNDFARLKKATFHHLGVIPSGIDFVKGNERFSPNNQLVELMRSGLRARIAETSASYTSDFDKGETRRELTATETMARVNSVNALVAGMMSLAYTYEEFKYQEICRRLSKGSHRDAKEFRKACLEDGVPKEALNSERWDVRAERVIGAGNKTIELAAVNFLQGIRKNLGPQAQRKVDHISIRSVTDQPDMADDLAPLEEAKGVSDSTHDAELTTDRLLRGLPLSIRPEMVLEEYVIVWLKDLAQVVQLAMQTGGADIGQVAGMQNLARHIGSFLQAMSTNEEERPKVRQYGDALGQIMNHVKALEQQAMEKAQSQGQDGEAAKAAAKIENDRMMAEAKAANARESHAQRTAQKQASFELEEQRKDRALEAEVQRDGVRLAVESEARMIEAASKPQPADNERA